MGFTFPIFFSMLLRISIPLTLETEGLFSFVFYNEKFKKYVREFTLTLETCINHYVVRSTAYVD